MNRHHWSFKVHYVLPRTKNSGRQCHFKIWLDCHKSKMFLAWLCPCQKNEKQMTINVIQHDDRLWYWRPFYNGAFSIVWKQDFDNQVFFARDSMCCICLKLPHCQCQILDFFWSVPMVSYIFSCLYTKSSYKNVNKKSLVMLMGLILFFPNNN
jgi:hypothetical protein